MLSVLRRTHVVGREVVDRDDVFVGTVIDTVPLDGGGEVELLLVRAGRRFGRPRYVPARGVRVVGERLRLPVSRDDIEDGPCAEDRRWGRPDDIARAYWVSAG